MKHSKENIEHFNMRLPWVPSSTSLVCLLSVPDRVCPILFQVCLLCGIAADWNSGFSGAHRLHTLCITLQIRPGSVMFDVELMNVTKPPLSSRFENPQRADSKRLLIFLKVKQWFKKKNLRRKKLGSWTFADAKDPLVSYWMRIRPGFQRLCSPIFRFPLKKISEMSFRHGFVLTLA